MPDVPGMSTKRIFHSSCLLNDEKWWISGGYNGANTSEYLADDYTPFFPYYELPEPMAYHTMVRVNFTSVIFVGNQQPSKKVYMLSTNTGKFIPLTDMQTARAKPQAG